MIENIDCKFKLFHKQQFASCILLDFMMGKACLSCIAIVSATICLQINAEFFLQTYQIDHHSEMIPNDAGFVLGEIDCISKVDAIGICMVTSGCQGINHFEENGRCQLVTNILNSTLYEAATSVSFLCEFVFQIFFFYVKVSLISLKARFLSIRYI